MDLIFGLYTSDFQDCSCQACTHAATRVLTGTRKRDHISPVLASLYWFRVKFQLEIEIILLTYKALNDQVPSYLRELIVSYRPRRSLCSLDGGLLVVL